MTSVDMWKLRWLELLRLYCRFDSYRRRYILAVMKTKSLPLFSCNFINFDGKFDSEKWLKNGFCQRKWNLVIRIYFLDCHPAWWPLTSCTAEEWQGIFRGSTEGSEGQYAAGTCEMGQRRTHCDTVQGIEYLQKDKE